MSTTKLSDKFNIIVAHSRDTQDYLDGNVPFVTSAEIRNGVVRCVEPQEDDRLFEGPCVVISGLGFATYQAEQFLPKGNGGDSCSVLYAKETFSAADYISFAACFNALHKWRFSFGRKCGVQRIQNLEIPWPVPGINPAWIEEDTQIIEIITNFRNTLFTKQNAQIPIFGQGINGSLEDNPEELSSI